MSAPSTAAFPARPSGRAGTFWNRLRAGDEIAYTITLTCALSILAIVAYLVYDLWSNSGASIQKFGWPFLWTNVWDPTGDKFGALAFIYGTVVTSALALIIGVPLGVGASIFLAELAPAKISNALTFLIELLAAVPSVIFGLLGIFILVPALKTMEPYIRAVLGWTHLFDGPFYGQSLLAAGVVLSVMVIPFIISISREVIMAVPNEQREGALALGATRWETTWDVVIPFARNGIMGSIFLALARSLGETMAVTMVIGNTPQIKASLFASGYTIPAVINSQFSEAGGLFLSALVEMGLVLFGLTILINGAARLLVLSTKQKGAS